MSPYLSGHGTISISLNSTRLCARQPASILVNSHLPFSHYSRYPTNTTSFDSLDLSVDQGCTQRPSDQIIFFFKNK
ncbi:unnamed protein product [Toxocara canis]|uniref:Ovule protein n=1 Tax=Toxocara canis TaxID=6265 RepID=A0A183U5Q2_TOXCA|nr:unnamed protein product [Toxocara canis]